MFSFSQSQYVLIFKYFVEIFRKTKSKFKTFASFILFVPVFSYIKLVTFLIRAFNLSSQEGDSSYKYPKIPTYHKYSPFTLLDKVTNFLNEIQLIHPIMKLSPQNKILFCRII